ncbi:hypothetical protein [Actinomadura roseirufa]|uniref:hypothetical protein n=1 Tax=Actinomadura roseirufa TaxID=2094049 RepID=UPI0010415C35|nr:hypothetical protein [Actinomadura roseirufa]
MGKLQQLPKEENEDLFELRDEVVKREWGAELELRPGGLLVLCLTNSNPPWQGVDVVVAEGMYRSAGGEDLVPVGDPVRAAVVITRPFGGRG